MTQTEKELLRAQDISFSYGERQVLWDISFSVESGQYVSLIGPNGSGKSTLFEILCGNRRAQEGNAYYKGRDIYEMDIRGRARHLAVIHQNEGISFPYTCMEMVLLGLHPHRARFERMDDQSLRQVTEIMERTGTLPFAEKLVTQLSGGEMQRVALARALAQRPKLLLMDEAMSDMDISVKMQMMALIKNLVRTEGLTVIGIHHDLNLAYRYSDRVLALREGHLVAQGKPVEVMTESFFQQVFDVRAEVYPEKGFFIL